MWDVYVLNYWTGLSADFAQQNNYLDELYAVYPIAPNKRRTIPEKNEARIREAFGSNDKVGLIKELLKLELFPIKDSYIAYFKEDKTAIGRNPQTVNRISDILFKLGIEEILRKCAEPKESNRQIGPMFKRWIDKNLSGFLLFILPKNF